MTRLVIVGDGPERAALTQTASRLGIADRTIMTGALSAPERILGRFDVFALSSNTEQMPNSVLEAMAASLPILATDVGDVKHMVAPANARFVISQADGTALAAGLSDLVKDRALREQIGRANGERVRADYSLAAMVTRYDDLFTTATAS
jgi:glycosyltransferase involved in cell wall biosynthesis